MLLLTAIYCPVYFYVDYKCDEISHVDQEFNKLKICYPWVWWNNLMTK